MRFVDETARGELAKSSTILQCILSILDFECNKFHFQPEVLDVKDNSALVNMDPMNDSEIIDACKKVNAQFKRKDKKPTCSPLEFGQTFIICSAALLEGYEQVQ